MFQAKWRLQSLEEMVENTKRNVKKMTELKITVEKLAREAATVALRVSCHTTFEQAFKIYRENLNVSFSEFMDLADTLNDYNSDSDEECRVSAPKRKTPVKHGDNDRHTSKWRSQKGLQGMIFSTLKY